MAGVNAGGRRGDDVSDEVRALFERPPDWARIITVGDVVSNVAGYFERDPIVCLAYFYMISGLNPRAAARWVHEAVEGFVLPNTPGARPTAFGIAGLREGVDLEPLTRDEVYNPAICAAIALRDFEAWRRIRSDILDPLVMNDLILDLRDDNAPASYLIARDANAGVGLPFP